MPEFRPFHILGIDPGFANLGFSLCVAGRTATGERTLSIQKMGCVFTEASSKKRNVLAADDNLRRTRELVVALDKLLGVDEEGRARVRVICAESMSFPRNASNAAKVALSWGIIGTLSVLRDVPVVQASPQEIKLAVAGAKTASKEEIQAALQTRFHTDLTERLTKVDGSPLTRKDAVEHPYDSLAAIVACMGSEVLKALWRR